MSRLSLALKVAVGLLMVDSVIELAFVSSMVSWLHRTASKGFSFKYGDSTYHLAGEPLHIMTDQGHTSNGAAGTAFVLIGLGGILALWLRSWSRKYGGMGTFTRFIYYLWVALNIPALLLTTGALAYVFAVTNAHEGQSIDVPLATTLNGSKYPLEFWTPQNWFSGVMRGWQYNLIPMFIVQLGVTILAVWEFLGWRRQEVFNRGEK
ncbi:hypothetical protein F5Y00DRAFT_230449 [Daldinia vernicosa]|uniref:uncharacterized protein n=1 Tax=Daldinia vernicosa TaxID=114800 RepID=UPI002008BADE|nr:uncharacterized protein F5Y00DRAFT_230449 [Daldinia vernicosa]KAI0851151.1 hypothetical protein F5Y00DRAFT_230449 [Daldinia vernicosa]